jgi:hypothetical protein
LTLNLFEACRLLRSDLFDRFPGELMVEDCGHPPMLRLRTPTDALRLAGANLLWVITEGRHRREFYQLPNVSRNEKGLPNRFLIELSISPFISYPNNHYSDYLEHSVSIRTLPHLVNNCGC